MAAFVFHRGQLKRRPTRSMAQAHLSRIGGIDGRSRRFRGAGAFLAELMEALA